MNTVKILVIAVLISGGLCGMAGFMEYLYRVYPVFLCLRIFFMAFQ